MDFFTEDFDLGLTGYQTLRKQKSGKIVKEPGNQSKEGHKSLLSVLINYKTGNIDGVYDPGALG